MQEQLPLFQRKKFSVTPTQGIEVKSPVPGASILSTLPAYFNYLQSQGYSQYTLADFCGDVKKLGLFMREKALGEVGIQDIRQWLSQLRTVEHMTEKSISRKLAAINNYFTWLVSEKVLKANPGAAIPNYKVSAPLPEILFAAEVKRLLEVVSGDVRSYFLVLLLLETGVKIEELMDLQLIHIDTSNPYAPEIWIKHIGKKVKKDRKLKLPREVVPVLADYVAQYQITDRLFPVTQRLVRYILISVGERAGLQKRVTTQLLRYTCAIRWLKSGEAIETVLEKLGLSETTWEDLKEVLLKLVSRAL